MKRKTMLNDADQKILKSLYWLLYQSGTNLVKSIKAAGRGLSTEVIHDTAAKIWQCDKKDFYGKVDHKNAKEKIKKYSFFAACYVFGNDDAYDTAVKFGVKGSLAWRAKNGISQEIGHRAGHSGPLVQDFFLTLNNMLPSRLQQLREFATPRKEKTLYEEVSDHAAIVADYAKSGDFNYERFMLLIKEQHTLAVRLSEAASQQCADIKKGFHQPEITNSTIVYLVCKNDVKIKRDGYKFSAKGLAFLDRYTSPGLFTDSNGYSCYKINELGGQAHLADRFHVCKKTHPKQ